MNPVGYVWRVNSGYQLREMDESWDSADRNIRIWLQLEVIYTSHPATCLTQCAILSYTKNVIEILAFMLVQPYRFLPICLCTKPQWLPCRILFHRSPKNPGSVEKQYILG